MKNSWLGGLATLAALGAASVASAGAMIDFDQHVDFGGLVDDGPLTFDDASSGSGTVGQFDWTVTIARGTGLASDGRVWTFCSEFDEIHAGRSGDAMSIQRGLLDGAARFEDGGTGAFRLSHLETRSLNDLLGQPAGRDGLIDASDITKRAAAGAKFFILESFEDEGTTGYRLNTADGSSFEPASGGSGRSSGADAMLERVNAAIANGSVGSFSDGQLVFPRYDFDGHVMMIPLPAPALMGLVGLGLASIARRRLRRG